MAAAEPSPLGQAPQLASRARADLASLLVQALPRGWSNPRTPSSAAPRRRSSAHGDGLTAGATAVPAPAHPRRTGAAAAPAPPAPTRSHRPRSHLRPRLHPPARRHRPPNQRRRMPRRRPAHPPAHQRCRPDAGARWSSAVRRHVRPRPLSEHPLRTARSRLPQPHAPRAHCAISIGRQPPRAVTRMASRSRKSEQRYSVEADIEVIAIGGSSSCNSGARRPLISQCKQTLDDVGSNSPDSQVTPRCRSAASDRCLVRRHRPATQKQPDGTSCARALYCDPPARSRRRTADLLTIGAGPAR